MPGVWTRKLLLTGGWRLAVVSRSLTPLTPFWRRVLLDECAGYQDSTRGEGDFSPRSFRRSDHEFQGGSKDARAVSDCLRVAELCRVWCGDRPVRCPRHRDLGDQHIARRGLHTANW